MGKVGAAEQVAKIKTDTDETRKQILQNLQQNGILNDPRKTYNNIPNTKKILQITPQPNCYKS